MNYYAAFAVVLMFFAGLFLDQKFKTGYAFAISGMVIGIIYIGYEIWKCMRKD